jgi:DNA-binding CsgD family transcriptional regulator
MKTTTNTTKQIPEFDVPTRGELALLLRLMNDLHDIAEEPRLWKRHFLGIVGRLIGTPVGTCALVHDVLPGKAWRYASVVDLGWAGDHERDAARRWFAGDGPVDPMEQIAQRPGGTVTATRREILPDQVWQAAPHVQDVRRQARIDDCIYSLCRLAEPGWAMCLSFHRPWGDRRRLGDRERVLVHLAHSGLGPMYEREARIAEIVGGANGSRKALTPRMRQTLDLLLAGLSEKEAARKLRLSPNTLHVHVRSLYRHYDVNTRAELMAKLLPHARGGAVMSHGSGER